MITALTFWMWLNVAMMVRCVDLGVRRPAAGLADVIGGVLAVSTVTVLAIYVTGWLWLRHALGIGPDLFCGRGG